jgi:hypothetical protein
MQIKVTCSLYLQHQRLLLLLLLPMLQLLLLLHLWRLTDDLCKI